MVSVKTITEEEIKGFRVMTKLEDSDYYVPKDAYYKFDFDIENWEARLPKNEGIVLQKLRQLERKFGFLTPLLYFNIVGLISFHMLALIWSGYYVYHGLFTPKWQTLFFSVLMACVSILGVTAGAHRLWTHRSFKATLPFRIICTIAQTTAGQYSIRDWVHDHRVHHKFSDTLADPHSCSRGIFYAHCGWLMMRRHPAIIAEGKRTDMSDIESEPLLRFQHKYYTLLKLVFCYTLPAAIPVYFWKEDLGLSVLMLSILRYLASLHAIWSVNSFAHKYGFRPYDKTKQPSENWTVTMFSLGEGLHNFHHTFPWDYRTSEFMFLNGCTVFLDLCAKIGWVYDRKVASPSLIEAVAKKKGDGTFYQLYHEKDA